MALAFGTIFWEVPASLPMRSRFVCALLLAFAAVALASCKGEGEGMPCDTRAGNNGNDDCQSPLVCTPGLSVNGPRCCPVDRQHNATTPECALGSGVIDASTAPPEASIGVEAGTDAPDGAGDVAPGDGSLADGADSAVE
jgi:hypothetical protein